jgi:eukaryotic-like serine/threonine-protein kinase
LLEPGQIFATRYLIQRRIAEGGMGAIFEAQHTGTERRVALKLLFPHIISVASARAKFELEAKVSARVNSPYIVEVLDAGFDELTQSPYLVMELLSGQSLAAYVKERGRLDFDEALGFLRQVAAGLDAAHGYTEASGAIKPIVHRDLKPENLFVTQERDGSRRVKILDFGIAKVLGDTGNVSQEVRGTPLYMAFEQVTAGALSPETDVWALGLITYYLMTGLCYWRAARRDAGVQALFAEILSLPIEAPSLRLRQQDVALELPAGFDGWFLKCLDREPARRFGSAGAAVGALANIVDAGRGTSPGQLPELKREQSRELLSKSPERRWSGTATFEAPSPVRSGAATAGSLPAIVGERRSRSPSRSVRWLALALIMGLALVGGAIWALRGGEPVARHAASPRPSSAPAAQPANHPASEAPATNGTAPETSVVQKKAPLIAPVPAELSAAASGATEPSGGAGLRNTESSHAEASPVTAERPVPAAPRNFQSEATERELIGDEPASPTRPARNEPSHVARPAVGEKPRPAPNTNASRPATAQPGAKPAQAVNPYDVR